MPRDVLIDGYAFYLDEAPTGGDDGGLFYRDTRHLSTFDVEVTGADLATLGREFDRPNRRTLVASSAESAVNSVDDAGEIKQGTVSLRLTQTVTEADGLAQRVELAAHASGFEGGLVCTFDADFADVFEVRGFASGIDRSVDAAASDRTVRYRYGYRDAQDRQRERHTAVTFDRLPVSLTDGRAVFDVSLDPGESTVLDVAVRPVADPDVGDDGAVSLEYATIRPRTGDESGFGTDEESTARADESALTEIPPFETGDERFDELLDRAARDLGALTTQTDHGPVPLAGAPWFATVFGRDSLIASYQALPVAPSLARGTLRYLAANRGRTTDEVTEEAPGKVFHEERNGELARCGRIPHTPYYGTVDATPLWVVLLGELWRWTEDDDLVHELADPLADALDWVETARDRFVDDPFLYYDRSPDAGLRHKAWRDTPGSVQYPDGRNAPPPVASVEVQGYVYGALREAATLYGEVLTDSRRADTLREEADELAAAFDDQFWVPAVDYYAVAKDGEGGVVPTLTSNVGHCLWTGIVPDERVDAVADRLLSPELFSGWGIRTVGRSTDGYSPVSYHLGSVWPHDTSLVALGLAEVARYDAAERLARSLLEACVRFEAYRIPELFCGFDDDLDPLTYPSSCVPQAWSAGAPFAALRASFGLDARGSVSVGNRPEWLIDGAIDPILDRWNAAER